MEEEVSLSDISTEAEEEELSLTEESTEEEVSVPDQINEEELSITDPLYSCSENLSLFISTQFLRRFAHANVTG
jgi:hypothetical protein